MIEVIDCQSIHFVSSCKTNNIATTARTWQTTRQIMRK